MIRFRIYTAFVGQVIGGDNIRFWSTNPIGSRFDPSLLIDLDLIKSSAWAESGGGSWNDVEYETVMTTIGTSWPNSEPRRNPTFGRVYLAQKKWPASYYQGLSPCEHTCVTDGGKWYHGFRVEVVASLPEGRFVIQAYNAQSQTDPVVGIIGAGDWLDMSDICDGQLTGLKVTGSGPIFLEWNKARSMFLEVPKLPTTTGGGGGGTLPERPAMAVKSDGQAAGASAPVARPARG